MEYWFQNPKEYRYTIDALGISEDRYKILISLIIKTFPQKWIESQFSTINKQHNFICSDMWPSLIYGLRYNPIPVILVGKSRGWPVIINIIRLGELLLIAEDHLGNKETIFNKLMGNAADFISTLFELETLKYFYKSGFCLFGNQEVDGVDFTFIKDNQIIYVEATHRGPQWLMDVFSKLGESQETDTNEHYRVCVRLHYKKANRFVQSDGADKLVYDIYTDIINNCADGFVFEDEKNRYSIEFSKTEKGCINFKWYEKCNPAYDAAELFKGRLNDKRRQLSQNDFSFCSIDMRAVLPRVIDKKTHEECLKYLKRIFNHAQNFLKLNKTVAGIFTWIEHFEGKNRISDCYNRNKVILFNNNEILPDDMARKLFPLAVSYKDFRNELEERYKMN